MTRSVVAEAMLFASAPTPPAAESGGAMVIVVVAIIAAVGTVATALGPTFVEMAKNRSKGSAAPQAPATPGAQPAGGPVVAPLTASPGNPLTPVVQSGIDALSMVDAAVQDYRRQRDAALARADHLQAQLDAARGTIHVQLVEMTQLKAQMGQYEVPEHRDPYGRQQPMYTHEPRPDGPAQDSHNEWGP